jgi:16S rRNA (cytosine1402-N4)-methyltransferase
MAIHIPVFLEDTLNLLLTRKDGIYLDLTTGEGGHSLKIAEFISGKGKLLCFDRDEEIQAIAKENLKDFENVSFVLDNFSNFPQYLKPDEKATGILADLGLSMFHYKISEKGFSFLREDPLNMGLDKNTTPDLYEIVNHFSEQEIADIIYQYGEERASRKIASFIVRYRQEKTIENTKELAEIIRKAFPPRGRRPGFHPATRSFQAFRIYINREFENLKTMLAESIDALETGGRVAVITYHSLEDRIVKWFFREQAQEKRVKILTKKPIMPTREEMENNPSSRSAKLRVAEKI